MNFIVDAVLASSTQLLTSSLDGIDKQGDQDVAYVQGVNRYFRWFAASTETADGALVVIPRGQDAGVAGRWFAQGPPGQAGLIPGLPAGLLGTQKLSLIASATPQTLSGGADKVLASIRVPIVVGQKIMLAYVIQGQAQAAATMSAWMRPGGGAPIDETISIRALGLNEYYNFACIKEFTAPDAAFQAVDLMFANGTEDFELAFGAIFALNLGA